MNDTLFLFLQNYAAATGADIRDFIDQKGYALLADVDARINTLTGQDVAINAFLDKIKLLTDAVPGTPEFDEGSNLFTLISTKFAEAIAAAGTAGTAAASAAAAVAQVVVDLSALAARVLSLESESTQARSDINGLRTNVDSLLGELTVLSAGAASVFASFTNALRGTTAP